MTQMNNVIDGKFMFVCTKCLFSKSVDLKGAIHNSVTIKCTCGHRQKHFLNYRSTVRVNIQNLFGVVTIPNSDDLWPVQIEDVSMSGAKLAFTVFPDNLNIDDLIDIKYTLTDNHKTLIHEKLKVVRLAGTKVIGVQVHDVTPYSKQVKRKHFWLCSFLEGAENLKMDIDQKE